MILSLKRKPEEWHLIIREAVDIRKGIKSKAFHSIDERIIHSIEFSKYVIKHCNEWVTT
ncbi:hypothetical protein HF072_06105 [Bacillus sp. RO3]|nr:hypothetical protein [Bacillus sp. RO3]